MRADPVESFAVGVAFFVAELDPVAASEIADLTGNLAIIGTPDRAGANEDDFLNFDAVVDAACDQQVALFRRAGRRCRCSGFGSGGGLRYGSLAFEGG